MKIVITGVSGFIGSELARRFLRQGHQVVGLSRHEPKELGLSSFHAVALGDLLPEEALLDADLMIHAAHDRTPGARWKNVEGTMAWADQGRFKGVKRQLFLSSVSAHADSPSEYGQAKAQLEDYFVGIGALLVRPGLVLGQGGTFGNMATMIRRAPVLPIFGGDRLQVVLTDMGTLFEVLAKFQDLKPGQVYNLFQPEWVGMLSLAQAVRRHFKSWTLLVPVPLGLSVSVLSAGQKFGLPPTLSPESLKNLEHVRGYGYVSSYQDLQLPIRSFEEMMQRSFT